MCGVFGIHSLERDIARLAYFGLFALQHRGQESAGIAVSESGRLTVLRDMGLVSQVFDERKLSGLHGELAIGHTRYSTTGSSHWSNAQPLVHHGRARTVALGHNGNIVNAAELRVDLHERGIKLASTADTEVIAALIASDEASLEQAVTHAMTQLEGAFSVVAISEGTLLAFRDRHGFRPLCLGRLGGDWVVASETCALDLVGADRSASSSRGELVVVDEDGLRSRQDGSAPTPARSASSSSSTSLGRTRGSRASRCTLRAYGWVSGWPRRRLSKPTSCCRSPRLRDAGGDRLRAGLWHPVQRGPDQEPLCRPHVHPARPGAAPAGIRLKFQPGRRGRGRAGW